MLPSAIQFEIPAPLRILILIENSLLAAVEVVLAPKIPILVLVLDLDPESVLAKTNSTTPGYFVSTSSVRTVAALTKSVVAVLTSPIELGARLMTATATATVPEIETTSYQIQLRCLRLILVGVRHFLGHSVDHS